jgi:hypothetical protein
LLQNKLNKFYFLHIPKTGGRFINMNIINPLRPLLEHKGVEVYPMGDNIYQPNHHNWNINFIDDNTYIMTIFRDPAKRTVSQFIETEGGSPDFQDKYNVDYFINWVKNTKYSKDPQSKCLLVEKPLEQVEESDYDFIINEDKLLKRIKRINLFLKHQQMNALFCHKIQSKIIDDFNIVTEKSLYPINHQLFIEKISNNLSMKMFNQLNKDQIDFLYNNSPIDSEVYFNLSEIMI